MVVSEGITVTKAGKSRTYLKSGKVECAIFRRVLQPQLVGASYEKWRCQRVFSGWCPGRHSEGGGKPSLRPRDEIEDSDGRGDRRGGVGGNERQQLSVCAAADN